MLLRLPFVVFAVGAVAAPSPQSLNSSLTLLIDNDLQGVSSPVSNSGVLLLEARSLKHARETCEAVGEQLWSLEKGTKSIQANLDYLKYSNLDLGLSKFWIASKNQSARAVDIDGHVVQENPDTKLPVLCSQSAPFSNVTFQDTGEKWQVIVKSNNESLTGYRDRLSFRFLGVRYAPQPKRFTYSESYVGNGSEVSALEYGSQCVQAGNIGSEDCLFLNVWTTHIPGPKTAKKLKPVMFWIHGGAFINGAASDPTFDGGNLASRGDVVVVTVGYRLTTLGFLALNDGVTNGNFGLADQINALEWVRKNIKDFGGDPDKITIFGQSAGAGSVHALIASPKSIGKFAGAIPVSNLASNDPSKGYTRYYTIEEEVEALGNTILEETGCANATSQVGCLRSISPHVLAGGLSTYARFPVVDGTYLTSDRLPLEGPTLPVRIMTGTTRDDGAAFIGFPTTTTNATAYFESQGYAVPPPELFPIPDLANKSLALFDMAARLVTDSIFRCGGQAEISGGLRNGRFHPVYFYEFNRTYQLAGWPGLDVCSPPKTAGRPHGDPGAEYRKCHSGELYYVFGNLVRQGLPLRDEADLPFQQFVLDVFSSFARTFDPNPAARFLQARGFRSTFGEIGRAGRWEPATAEGGMTRRILQWPSAQEPFGEREQCEYVGLPWN
ncbi:cholinesterase [Daldinia caldariorum]|uniref:cholinesterase n=1 Tax=Daldinia caldariorum TaxID=326644 RepID=UPI002008B7AA|nr:cholinesterase [Daldinia caldariorum]KAI1467047.1 cholinesterase [Daldinia caldariorum]